MNARKHNAFLTCISFGALWATEITGTNSRLRVRGDSADFCLVRPILLRYVSMISRAEQRTVWINAYNAAMTGLLSAKAAHMESYTENNVSVITEQCKAFAGQALKDVAAFASDMLE